MVRQRVAAAAAAVLTGAYIAEAQARRRDERRNNKGRGVEVLGAALRVYEEGSGPSVVIVTGAGDSFASWFPIQHALADHVRVTGYDRPGVGASAGGAPPTAARYLGELDRIIEMSSDGRPVTLVGHSLGGLLARLYTRKYPSKVRALVLVDATPPNVADDAAMRAAVKAATAFATMLKVGSRFGVTRAALQVARLPMTPALRRYLRGTTRDHYDEWLVSIHRSISRAVSAELSAVVPLARYEATATTPADPIAMVPLVVIGSAAFGKRWTKWQEQLSLLSSRGRFMQTHDHSHNVHLRHPEVVVEAVLATLADEQPPRLASTSPRIDGSTSPAA